MTVCEGCGRGIAATAADPAVSATSLGRGTFHMGCASERWRKIAKGELQSARRHDDADEIIVVDEIGAA